MISSLQDLVASLSEKEFLRILRTRDLTFYRGAAPNRFAGLVNWEILEHLFASGTYPSRGIVARRRSVKVPEIFYSLNGKVALDPILRWMSEGISLVLVPLDEHVPALATLSQSISRSTGERVWSGAIVSTGSGGAFNLHFDPEDLLILQVEGSKRWQVYGPPVPNPVRPMDLEPPSTLELVFDEVLNPGDVLFLPAGQWHHGDNVSERSLHAGVFLEPLSPYGILQSLAGDVLSDERFRQPLTRMSGKPAATEAELKALLVEKIGEVSLAAELERHRLRPIKSRDYGARK